MIDIFNEHKKLKIHFNQIKYLLFEKGTELPLVVDSKKAIKKIKEIIKIYNKED